MKKTSLFSGQRLLNRRLYLFILALFMSVSSAFAIYTVDSTATATAVSVAGTIDMRTDIYYASTSDDPETNLTDSKIDNSAAGSFYEYKITPNSTGDFNVIINGASKQATALVNVSLLAADGVTVLNDGDSLYTKTGSNWNTYVDFVFSIGELTLGSEYIIKVLNIGNNTNIQGISVVEAAGFVSLTELNIDGELISGFAQYATSYDLGELAMGTTQIDITAVASEVGATITGIGTVALVEGSNTIEVTVTSADNQSSYTYTITAEVPLSSITQTVPATLDLSMDVATSGIGDVFTAVLGSIKGGDCFAQFEIVASETADYIVTIEHGTNSNPMGLVVGASTDGVNFTYSDTTQTTTGSYKDQDKFYAFSVSLTADEVTTLEINYTADATDQWLGNTYSIVVAKDVATQIADTKVELISVSTQFENIALTCDASFVGGQVEIFTISGQLVSKNAITATTSNYSVDGNALYILRVTDSSNLTTKTLKCVVQ